MNGLILQYDSKSKHKYMWDHSFWLWLNGNGNTSFHITMYRLYEMAQVSQHLRLKFPHLYNSCKDQNEVMYLKGHYKL